MISSIYFVIIIIEYLNKIHKIIILEGDDVKILTLYEVDKSSTKTIRISNGMGDLFEFNIEFGSLTLVKLKNTP